MVMSCCVYSCKNVQGKGGDISFFRFPLPKKGLKNPILLKLVKERQIKWKKALNLNGINDSKVKHIRVCSKHFVTGKKAKLLDNLHPDWIPSMHLGYINVQSKNVLQKLKRNRTIPKRNEIKNEPKLKTEHKIKILEIELLPQLLVGSEDVAESEHETEYENEQLLISTVEQASQTEEFYINEAVTDYHDKKYELLKTKYDNLKERFNLMTTKKDNTKLKNLKENPPLVKYLTGFVSFTALEIIYNHCKPFIPFSTHRINKEDVFIMMLSKLRLNLPFSYLAYSHGVSIKTISKLFYDCLGNVYRRLGCFVFLPDKTAHIQNTHEQFKKVFGNKRVFILDCLEIFCEKSGKKYTSESSDNVQNPSIKFLICISSFGSICFISKGYEGRFNNKYIIENCGVLNLIQDEDIVMLDHEILIGNFLQQKKSTLIIPLFKNSTQQLEPLEIESHQDIASLRCFVERITKTLRSKYFLPTNKIPNILVSKKIGSSMYLDCVMKVSCAVINLNCSNLLSNQPLEK